MRLIKNIKPQRKPIPFALDSLRPTKYMLQDTAAFSRMLKGTNHPTWFFTAAISSQAAR